MPNHKQVQIDELNEPPHMGMFSPVGIHKGVMHAIAQASKHNDPITVFNPAMDTDSILHRSIFDTLPFDVPDVDALGSNEYFCDFMRITLGMPVLPKRGAFPGDRPKVIHIDDSYYLDYPVTSNPDVDLEIGFTKVYLINGKVANHKVKWKYSEVTLETL